MVELEFELRMQNLPIVNINSIWDKFEKLEVIHLNIKWYFNVIMFKINLQYIYKESIFIMLYLSNFWSHEPSNFQGQNSSYEWNDVQFYVTLVNVDLYNNAQIIIRETVI